MELVFREKELSPLEVYGFEKTSLVVRISFLGGWINAGR